MVLATSQQELSQFHGVRASNSIFPCISTPTLASERAVLYIDFFIIKDFKGEKNSQIKTIKDEGKNVISP